MLLKLAKAGLVLSATAFFMPAEKFGSMPGLGEDAPAQFAHHGGRAVDTLLTTADAACEREQKTCDQLALGAQSAKTVVTGSIHNAVDQTGIGQNVLHDPIARQIALEAAKGIASNL